MNRIKVIFGTTELTPTNRLFQNLLRGDVAEADSDIKRRHTETVPKQLSWRFGSLSDGETKFEHGAVQ
jgi:hypothetical protein